jgi:hypothetical protein
VYTVHLLGLNTSAFGMVGFALCLASKVTANAKFRGVYFAQYISAPMAEKYGVLDHMKLLLFKVHLYS